jgi:hypothetical protein
MDNQNLRYGVIAIILIALAGGVWTRRHSEAASEPSVSEEIGPGLGSSGIKTTGSFEEPVTGMAGFEASLPGCARPAAILPVSASNSAIIPTAFRYHSGDYDISYIYNGRAYPEAGISYRLSFLYTFYRIQSLLGLMHGGPFGVYLKVWSPAGCPEISTSVASTLERRFIAAQRPPRG